MASIAPPARVRANDSMAITKEQVFAAADALDAAGERATVQDVRAVVGGGSFTTLSAWLQDWRVRRAAEELRSRDLEAARERIAELETARRELQARLQVLEMALLATTTLITGRHVDGSPSRDDRDPAAHWSVAVNPR